MTNWQKDIQNKVGGFEVKPSENLMRKLEADGVLSPNSGRRHVVPAWVWYSVASTAAALVFLVLVERNEFTQQDRMSSPTAEIIAPIERPQVLADATIPQPKPLYLRERVIADKHWNHSSTEKDDSVTKPEFVSDELHEIPSIEAHESKKTDSPEEKEEFVENSSHTHITDPFSFADFEDKKPERRSHIAIAFLGSIGTQSTYSPKPINMQDRYVNLLGAQWGESSVLADILCNASDKKGNVLEEKYSHRLPLKFGLSLEYKLNKRWSITSGLNYSFLVSDIYASEGAPEKSGVQKLSYVGIPLNFKFTALSARKFNAYITAGGAADYCISGNRDNICNISGSRNSRVEKYSEHPFQLSINASVGAEYSFLNYMSLFIEGGVSNYFNDGSTIETIYKEKPIYLNTNVGIRFKFGN